MKTIVIVCNIVGMAALVFAADQEKSSSPMQNTTAVEHHVINAADLQWADAPPGLPAGGKIAALNGDPSKPGPFTVRLKMPAGYVIAPHTHPSDERVTVLSGNARVGMSDKANEAFMKEIGPGGYVVLPAGMAHYVKTKSEVIVQIDSEGPFQINYVNPADDPRNKETKK